MITHHTADQAPAIEGADAPVAADPPDAVPSSTRLASFVVVVAPFAAFIVAIVWLWGWGIGWSPLIVLAAMVVLTTLGITVGFHRLFTHRSFQTTRPVQAVLAALGSMAAEGPVVKWAAVHRRHHQHSDTPRDPHSPHLHGQGLRGLIRGLWHAHAGWLFAPDPPGLTRYVPDLMANRLVRVMSRLFGLWVVVGLLVPAAIVGLLTMSWVGALQGFIWGGLVRIFLVHHVTWSINSACHLWGTRPFRTRDESRNNPVFGVLGLGEGWHNNHHAFPASARHGLRWWELDVSHLVIRALAGTGLAWNVRLPAPEKVAPPNAGGATSGRRTETTAPDIPTRPSKASCAWTEHTQGDSECLPNGAIQRPGTTTNRTQTQALSRLLRAGESGSNRPRKLPPVHASFGPKHATEGLPTPNR